MHERGSVMSHSRTQIQQVTVLSLPRISSGSCEEGETLMRIWTLNKVHPFDPYFQLLLILHSLVVGEMKGDSLSRENLQGYMDLLRGSGAFDKPV